VEAALEVFQTLFEVWVEGGGEGVAAAASVGPGLGVEGPVVEELELVGPEVGFDGAEAADLPLVVDEGVHQVALAGGDGVELGVVLSGEMGEGLGVFAADDVGLGVNAGFQGIHAGDGLAGLGARAGGFQRILTIRLDLFVASHKLLVMAIARGRVLFEVGVSVSR
jgi:hypothetical protein